MKKLNLIGYSKSIYNFNMILNKQSYLIVNRNELLVLFIQFVN